MIKCTLLAISIILLTSCSMKTPKNEWQYKSTNAFNSYTSNFLSGNDLMAKSDLQRAINHAKQSANLTQLAKIYLGECALNISVGNVDTCEEYLYISPLVKSKKLDAYYDFITLSIKDEDIKYLPMHHQNFAYQLNKKNFQKAYKDLIEMEQTTSVLLCGALIKSNLENISREELIKKASFHGYKKSAIFWLQEKKKNSDNPNEIKDIEKKILILN